MAKFKSTTGKLRTFKPAKRALPQGNTSLFIEDLADDGRGIARVGGKTVFVKGALPGETVEARYVATHKRFDQAVTSSITTASAMRNEPACQYFGRCGGCSLQHLDYPGQLQLKQQSLQRLLYKNNLLDGCKIIEPIVSGPFHYRHRVRFSVLANKQQCTLGFRRMDSHDVIAIESCQLVAPALNQMIPLLAALIGELKGRSAVQELSVVEDDDQQCALMLRAGRQLPDVDLQRLQQFSTEHRIDLSIAMTRADLTLQHWQSAPRPRPLVSRLVTGDITFEYDVNDFTQVNGAVNQQLVERALQWLNLSAADTVLDLFCGIGNFSLPIARLAGAVTGVELSAVMVAKAAHNARLNTIGNAYFINADLYLESLDLKALNSPTMTLERKYTKALLDPPRAGAERVCANMGSLGVNHLVYISCNPSTFFRDAVTLGQQGFKLKKIAIADMFPQTAHCELMGLFLRNDGKAQHREAGAITSI